MKLSVFPYRLKFKFEAGTSRGTLLDKNTFLLHIQHEDNEGWGEASPLVKLSIDDRTDYPDKLKEVEEKIKLLDCPADQEAALKLAHELAGDEWPSLRFGLETAFLDLLSDEPFKLFDLDFYQGKYKIPINGLIWMGDREFMLLQITAKVAEEYDCIKMKVGSIDFDKECDILRLTREKYKDKNLTLRVDANGAFTEKDAVEKLRKLAEFRLHSIEQPVAVGQHKLLHKLCQSSPVPIALDEELIGVVGLQAKRSLLEETRPQYIILKPSLIGGMQACEEWIQLANELNIGWWLTSALESNIGLNAISQFTEHVEGLGHQGLGTGQLYENNIPSPLTVKNGYIFYDTQSEWDLDNFKSQP